MSDVLKTVVKQLASQIKRASFRLQCKEVEFRSEADNTFEGTLQGRAAKGKTLYIYSRVDLYTSHYSASCHVARIIWILRGEGKAR
jgi:hypothetical protein